MASPEVVAVTTRSRLRGPRFFPAMLFATLRTRRQLRRTPGLVRYASVIGSPVEFWTLTVWSSLHEMQEFMRSGAHGDVMWEMPRWLRSFWLARWRPGPHEVGSWDGLELAAPEVAAVAPRGEPAEGPEFVRRALEEGSLTYAQSPLVRVSRAALGGVAGAVVRVSAPPWRLRRAFADVRRLRRLLEREPELVRVFVGVARFRDVYLFALWSSRDGPARLLQGEWARSARLRWHERLWVSEWLPENEFGHWDGLRMRRIRTRSRAFPSAVGG